MRLKEERNGTGRCDGLADMHVLMFRCAENDSLAGVKIVSRDEKLAGEIFEVITEAFIAEGFTEVGLQWLQREESRRELLMDEMWQIAQMELPVVLSVVSEDPQQVDRQSHQRMNCRPPVDAVNIPSSPVENGAFIPGNGPEESAGVNAIGDQGGND